MAVLRRKVTRELRASAGVLASVVAIIAIGTGTFIGLRSSQRILETSQEAYYRTYRFADFWIDLKKAPLSAVEQIARWPGIADLQARVTFDVILDLPGVTRPIGGRLISVPARGFESTINGICLVRGSGFTGSPTTRREEVILIDDFAREHGLEPGDDIELILNRKRQAFRIVGTAISPEYVYMVRGQGDIVPDPEHFGVLYVRETFAREVLDFQDACNQIIGRVVPGADDDVEWMLERMHRELESYGVLATTPRERQASHRFLADEIRGLAITAVIMPTIFLVVAALALNVLMSRLAERQRTVIGTLKAVGYSSRMVFLHFVSFGVVVGLIGGAAGAAAGIALTSGMLEMYKSFFRFPTFEFALYPQLLLAGVGISLAFAVAGTARGVWGVLELQPAEAMRARPPERGGAVFLERFPALWRRLGFRTHIALRSLARNPGRTLTNVFASGVATAIILMTLVFYDSMQFLVEFQFERVLHSDVDIGMRDEASLEALREARRLPGADQAEPVLGLVCDMEHGRRSRRLAITGLWPSHTMTTPMQLDLEPIDIPPEGLVMTRKLAELLDAEVGDRVSVTPVRGRREARSAWIASVVDGFLGLEVYADIRYLSELAGESLAVNSVQLDVNPARRDDLYRRIKNLPNAQGLNVRADAKHNIESTFVETMSFSFTLMILFAGVIAFGTVLNASVTEIADRTRDISTFRVLGYGPDQIAGIFFRQNTVVFALGLVVGLPLAYGLIMGSAAMYDTELFRMPIVIKPVTVAVSVATAMVFVLMAQFFVRRQVRRLDWVEGIKVKE